MTNFKKLSKDPYLIAEIGINHNGSIETAKKLIDISKELNFDCVKFQKRDPDVCVPIEQKNKMRETPWGNITYLQYKKKIEFGLKEFKILKKYAEKVKIDIFASCFDTNSLLLIKKLNFKFNKVPSAMITNLNFLNIRFILMNCQIYIIHDDIFIQHLIFIKCKPYNPRTSCFNVFFVFIFYF